MMTAFRKVPSFAGLLRGLFGGGAPSVFGPATDARARGSGGSRGRTLYLFEKDKSMRSACSGSCATFWPPLLTSGKPRAGAGVKAALLGTIRRAGGARQVTYGGHPLYTFKLERAGQTRGEGLTDFGPPFYAVAPTGSAIVK
jgi:predicted lipoprotein with Yx(FWY)xxD motif